MYYLMEVSICRAQARLSSVGVGSILLLQAKLKSTQWKWGGCIDRAASSSMCTFKAKVSC